MTSKIIECSLNSNSAIAHNDSNNYWTNNFNQEIELDVGDTINIQLACINTVLTGESIIELDSTKGENIGYIKCQFYTFYTVQNLQNDNDQLEWNPAFLLNPQIDPTKMIYSLPNGRFLTNVVTITLDPNQRFWTPDEIAQEINKQINATYCVNRLCLDGTGINTNRNAVLNPLQSLIYTTDNGVTYKGTAYSINGDSTSDIIVRQFDGTTSKFENSAFIVGASAPVFSWNANNSNKFSFSYLHSPVINYGTTSGATNNPTFNIQINSSTYEWGLTSSQSVIDLGGLLFQKCGFNIVANSVINTPSLITTFSTCSDVRPSVNFQGGNAVSQPDWILTFQPLTVPKFFDWNSSFFYAQNSIFTINNIGYYLLKSDIGTDGNFFSSEGKDELQIVSFLNKCYQSGTFYFCYTQTNPIIVTCKKVIKSVTLEILNPDLTIPDGLLPNSSVFIQILKNVN